MTRITFILPDEGEREVDAIDGESIMQAALRANIDGILAECGGGLMCATCHVYMDAADVASLPPQHADEADMLESAAAPLRPSSRLSCQIAVGPTLEGVVVRVPSVQL